MAELYQQDQAGTSTSEEGHMDGMLPDLGDPAGFSEDATVPFSHLYQGQGLEEMQDLPLEDEYDHDRERMS